MHAVLITADRPPFRSKSLCDQVTVPVDFIRILILVIVHEICTFHDRDQTVFTQSLHGKFRHFHRHLFVIKPLSVFFNSRAACADHTGKRDLFQIARDKSPASSGAQPRLMSVFP